MEFTTDDLFFTITTGTARKRLLMADPAGGLTSTRVPYATTNGRLTDVSTFTFDGTILTVANIKDSGLTSGRMTFATTSGQLTDSANATYSATTGLQIIAGATTAVPVIAKGAASQTADLFQAQDSASNVLSKIDVTGAGYFGGAGQSIIQTGMVVNQALDTTTNGIFAANGSAGYLIQATPSTNTIQLGLLDTYNSIATVRNGLQVSYAKVDLTAQTAAIGATTVYAVPASGVGMYRVCWVATVTTAAGTSSILGGTNGFQVVYTDGDDSVVKTTVAGATSAANTTATTLSGAIVVYAKASTNIQYSMDYTSVGSAMAFNLHVTVSKI
jgi:hypothetical protein